MSLECLAILGAKNEPLYLRSTQQKVEREDTDAFGFSESDSVESGLSIRQEFMMHAALDRLEEILGHPKHFDLVKMQRGSKWMGSLLPMEDYEIYGYVTPSNIKILALVERDSVIPLAKPKDTHIRSLFANVHEAYVRYTMNPFTKVRSKIVQPCSTFEAQVQDSIQMYNESLQKQTKS